MTIALSFGGGRQTTAMLLMAVNGELPRPDYVVFADTGAEWPETYDYMARYVKPLCEKEGLPFVTVRMEMETLYDWYWRLRRIPLVVGRACTRVAKLNPMHKLGDWTFQVGFSADEAGRSQRPSELKRVFPLIEERLTLTDCIHYIENKGWPSPRRSSCVFCPFQSPAIPRLLFEEHPELFEKVEALENRAMAAHPGMFIMGQRPWRSLATIQSNMFPEWNYGCADGVCFR